MAVILLVDDERIVLNVISTILRSAGHEVMTAANGLEGLAVFRSYQNMIELVITDLKMPEMDGFELIGRIRESRPLTKIICMSGFSEQECPQGVTFLQKPFRAEVVRDCVIGILTLQSD